MKPGFVGGVVVTRIDGFLEDMGKMPFQAGHFLLEPDAGLIHEIGLTLVPELVSMGKPAGDAPPRCFDDVLAEDFGVHRWQIAVPVHDLGLSDRCSQS